MRRPLKRRLLFALAVCAVLAGVSAAVVMAAQPGSSSAPAARLHTHAAARHGAGLLTTAAAYLGVSREQLRSELRSGKSLADIANATPGRSAEGLIQELESAVKTKLAARATRLHARVTAAVNGRGLTARRARHAGLLATAARYLGISRRQLRNDVRSGHTLAQVASSASGKSEAGLIQALVVARQADVTAEVKAGSISQTRAEALLAKLTQRITARVQAAHPAPGRRGSSAKG